MLNLLNSLLQSKLRIFCSKSYSLELLFVLKLNNIHKKCIEEIYESLLSPKPKQPSFDAFIQLLIFKEFVIIEVNKDKRKKTVLLNQKSIDLLDSIISDYRV